jgi:hypothetical protein
MEQNGPFVPARSVKATMQFSMERWSLWGSACGPFDEPMPLILRSRKFAGMIAL